VSAQVAIAAGYFPAYARLPRKAQRKADEFIRKFTLDPKQPSIHYEPIRAAVDAQLRSVRVGDDYRAIVRAPETGNVFVLLWIDHHDEAYRWAESKRLEVHPKTGTMQVFDLDAASKAVTDSSEEESDEAEALQDVRYEEKRLFSSYNDDQLFMGGVPRALLPAVRALYTDADLDRLVPHLPEEAADLLTGLAAGYDYDSVVAQILEPAPDAKAAAPVAIDTSDLAAALQRESTQREFRLLDDSFDLDKALTYPLDVWRIYLHPSQRKVVRARTKGPLRITGGAGTGKTVVAMHRAAFLAREVFKAPDDRILVTTFTTNLAHDISDHLSKLIEPEVLARIEVVNVDAWAHAYLRDRGSTRHLAGKKQQDAAWQAAIDLYGVDGFDKNFSRFEWQAVVQEQNLTDEESYVRAVRRYRGLPLSRAQRRNLWQVFDEYRRGLDAQNVREAVDILREARQALQAAGEAPRYRSVIVDEVQDLSAESLRLVRAIAGPERGDDLLLVGDAHQRIYGRPVALGQCGINVRGRRSQELRLNYRTTAAICRWSLKALGAEDYDDLDEGTSSTRGYVSLRRGQNPTLRHFQDAADERSFIASQVKEVLAAGRKPEEICVVARTGHLLDGYAAALQKVGIETEVLEKQRPRASSVQLATMHRVKGLEFPVVFVVAVNDGQMPLSTNELGSDDPIVSKLAETQERCLLYVATSRARDELHVTCYGVQSPFLAALAAVTTEPASQRRQLSEPAPASAEVRPPATEEPAERTEGPLTTAALDGVLSQPIDSWPLPTRMLNWAQANHVQTLRELASRAPLDLAQARNLGRRSISQTRAVLEGRTGRTWEELARSLGSVADEPRQTTAGWAGLRALVPEAFLDAPLDDVRLPLRMRNYCKREGLISVGQLISRSQGTLFDAPNLGRASVAGSREAIQDFVAKVEEARALWEAGFFASIKAQLSDFDTVPRMVLTRRAGLGMQAETLESIGGTLGVTRERVRQVEKKTADALAQSASWKRFLRNRFSAAVEDGSVALKVLEEDPWWTGVSEKPEALGYFAERLLEGAFHVVSVGEELFLASVTQSELDELRHVLKRQTKALVFPAPLAGMRALFEGTASRLGTALAAAVWGDLEELLTIDGDGPNARVTAFGTSKRAQIIAFLEAAPGPVSVGALTAAVGRGALPEEAFFFGRGLVGLRKHFPDFERWRAELAPIVIDVMRTDGPERQWSCVELINEVRERAEIPEWLEHWHLASILRRSEGIVDLGRLRVALPGASEGTERVHIDDALRKLLEDHGEPMAHEALLERLRKAMDFTDASAVGRLLRPPFLRCDAEHWGLRERDLPGGVAASSQAVEHIEAVLARRERGLSSIQLHRELTLLSSDHARWTPEMSLSILRADSRFRLTVAGNVGLGDWDTVRVPTRAEIVQQCIAEGSGKVTIAAVEDRMRALYGDAWDRVRIGAAANRVGAGLAGDELVLGSLPEGAR